MNPSVRNTERLVWVGVLLTTLLLMLAALASALKLRRAAPQSLPVLNPIADFQLTNQAGAAVSLADLKGAPWVADIIFTRCAGPCPQMTRQMRELQKALGPNSTARLVTLTTDPEFDSPEVLAAYARKFEAETKNWMFLTGSRTEISKLAVDSLKLVAAEKRVEERVAPEDLFIHSTAFVLVDGKSRLRAIFQTDTDEASPADVRARIVQAVKRLERQQ